MVFCYSSGTDRDRPFLLPLFNLSLFPWSFLFLFLSLYILPLLLWYSDLLSISLPGFNFSHRVLKSHGRLHCDKEQTLFYLYVGQKEDKSSQGWPVALEKARSAWQALGDVPLLLQPTVAWRSLSATRAATAKSWPVPSNGGELACRPPLLLHEEKQRIPRWCLTFRRTPGRCLVRNETVTQALLFPF